VSSFAGGLEHRQRTLERAALARHGDETTWVTTQARSEHVREGLAEAVPALAAFHTRIA
jgi:hypothetical protein